MKIPKPLIVLFFTVSLSAVCNAQQTSSEPATGLSQAFEKQTPQEEIARLESKRSNILYRIDQLSSNPETNAEEIARLKGLINYIDAKIGRLEKVIQSEEYAQQTGAPDKTGLTEEEYRRQKLEWKDSVNTSGQTMPIKTTLTRYEFEKLPKERQEKILSMPERYTIVD